MRVPLPVRLARGDVLLADGATGTMLQQAGLPPDLPGEAWVLERPEAVVALHRAYLGAGSDLVLTTTFGGTRPRLAPAGLDHRVPEVNRRAVELARLAAGEDAYVLGDIGPTGELMAPLGRLAYEDAVELFSEQARALSEARPDAILVETMSDLAEARAAVEAALAATSLPVFCTFSFDTHGRTSMGVSPARAAELLAGMGVAAMGTNCGHAPDEVPSILRQMRSIASGPFLIAKPNAGIPRLVKRQVVYDAEPARMGELAQRFVEAGAQIVGACCGSTPAHISAMAESLRARAADTSIPSVPPPG